MALGPRNIGVLPLLALPICLTGLRRNVCGDRKDLAIRDFEHIIRVVGGDGDASDLERVVVRGRRTVVLAIMSRN
jgi:hypothetical protein